MGSQYSFMGNKLVMDKLQGTSLLFSDFCVNVKNNCRHDNSAFVKKLMSVGNLPLDCDSDTMETIVHLWCIKCLSISKWSKLNSCLRNQLIQDFLDTLYCTTHAFDEVFLLLFTNAKSRLVLGIGGRTATSDLRDIVEDILRYSSSVGLKYYAYNNGIRCQESIADFPLKTFSLCPCTRRPLYVAMYLGRPDVVQLLLKYGSRIPYEDVCNCTEVARHPLRNVLHILRTSFVCKTDGSASEMSIVRTKRSILSLKLILVDLNHCSSLWSDVVGVLKELDADVESGTIPSLKHICRASVRQMMRGNFFLYHPHVWNILCLPQTLKSYMNFDYCNSSSCQD